MFIPLKRNNSTKGFTLIELLVVISIIALLSSIVLSSLNSARTKAREAAQKVAIDQTKKALQLYWTDNGSFPADTEALVNGSYISAVDANVLTYSPLDSDGNTCIVEPCESYDIVAVPLDEENKNGGQGTPPPAVDLCGISGDVTDPDCWSIGVGGLVWGPINVITNAQNYDNGAVNTANLATRSSAYQAAYHCANLTEGNVSAGTWYLPAYSQLLYGWQALNLNGFPSGDYWSSTESSNSYAFFLSTSLETMIDDEKTLEWYVRCLR
jgi:prepilin-type N-terminal cleavage/methylation domain-containing protein